MHASYDHTPGGIAQECYDPGGPDFTRRSRQHARSRRGIWEMVFGQLRQASRSRPDKFLGLSEECGGREWQPVDEVVGAGMEEGGSLVAYSAGKRRKRGSPLKPAVPGCGSTYPERRRICVSQLPGLHPK